MSGTAGRAAWSRPRRPAPRTARVRTGCQGHAELAAHRRLQLPEQAWEAPVRSSSKPRRRIPFRPPCHAGWRSGGLVVDGPGGRRRDGHQGHGEDHHGGATPMRHSAQDRRRRITAATNGQSGSGSDRGLAPGRAGDHPFRAASRRAVERMCHPAPRRTSRSGRPRPGDCWTRSACAARRRRAARRHGGVVLEVGQRLRRRGPERGAQVGPGAPPHRERGDHPAGPG